MNIAPTHWFRILHQRHLLHRISAGLVLAGFSGAAVIFYRYAYVSIIQFQQITPDQLARAITG